jgi:hypothetical protein
MTASPTGEAGSLAENYKFVILPVCYCTPALPRYDVTIPLGFCSADWATA